MWVFICCANDLIYEFIYYVLEEIIDRIHDRNINRIEMLTE